MPEQTLAVGQPIASKYAGLTGYTGPMIAPLEKIVGMIVGQPGSGKSALFQSHPGAYIFNLDQSSTTTPNPRATLWPGVGPGGQILTGYEGPLTWGNVEAQVDILKKLALDNKPRPDTIVFDGLTSAIRLLKAWIPPNAAKYSIAQGPKSDWNELHGPAAWDVLYETLTVLPLELHNYGYGVFYVAHVLNTKIPLDENRFIFKPQLTVTDNFWKRLYGNFELVAAVDARWEQSQEIIPQERKVGDRIVKSNKTITKNERKVYFATDNQELDGITKVRVGIPGQIELPLGSGWDTLSAVYKETAFTTSQETK